jgi:hypothetical protein
VVGGTFELTAYDPKKPWLKEINNPTTAPVVQEKPIYIYTQKSKPLNNYIMAIFFCFFVIFAINKGILVFTLAFFAAVAYAVFLQYRFSNVKFEIYSDRFVLRDRSGVIIKELLKSGVTGIRRYKISIAQFLFSYGQVPIGPASIPVGGHFVFIISGLTGIRLPFYGHKTASFYLVGPDMDELIAAIASTGIPFTDGPPDRELGLGI